METSKKTSEYFCQFQYRRSGINVKNARDTFLRGMRILSNSPAGNPATVPGSVCGDCFVVRLCVLCVVL